MWSDGRKRVPPYAGRRLAILEEQLASGGSLPGDVAFRLHDTYGFPVELTVEMAERAGSHVDLAGFEEAMDEQRRLARGRR